MSKYTCSFARKDGTKRFKKYCLGVFKCTVKGCSTVIRPNVSDWQKKFTPPVLRASQRCEVHGRSHIHHVPCHAILSISKNVLVGYVKLNHTGIHSHEMPPGGKVPALVAMSLKYYVNLHPSLTPLNFVAGVTPVVPPFGSIHSPLCLPNRMKRKIRKMKKSTPSDESILDIRQWQSQNKERFIVLSTYDTGGAIVIQTDFMRERMQRNLSGFKTDASKSALKIF